MRLILAAIPLLLAGCAALSPVPETHGIDAVLIGEQHDAEAHPRLQERWVSTLAERGQLGAVALEMAERGTSTAGLPPTASDEQVQQALKWNKGTGWPWGRYGPAIMAAVRAGVPQHLPTTLVARSVLLPAQDTGKDYCEDFRKEMEKKRPQAAT